MDFDLPFYHQNTHINIRILVVDDDPLFLSIFSDMLKTPTYIDKSFGEITVMTANGSSEALSTLRCHCNNIDVVITEYHISGLNGVQLKRRIKEEFGNLPVIVISAVMNNEIEQETLSSQAMCFMRKPIKQNDINIICQHALNHKINGGSKGIQKTNSNGNPDDGSSGAKDKKKSKIIWTSSLEDNFEKAIQHIGVDKVTPTKILEFMNVNYLTRAHVASKLQKYRKFLKKLAMDEGGIEETRSPTISNIPSSGYLNRKRSYNYETSLSSNYLFKSQRGYDLGQSSPTMNKDAGFHGFDKYMNGRFTYSLSQTGSNIFPRRGSGMFGLKEGTSQESQAHKYVGIRIDEKGNASLGGRVNATGNSSLRRTRVQGNNKSFLDGPLGEIRVHGDESLGGLRVNSTGYNNGSLDGVIAHGNSNANSSPGGMRVHDTSSGSPGGIQVHGVGAGAGAGYASLGENLSGMNWNFSNNNNMSNHECSTSKFPSALSYFINSTDQSQNYLNNAQTGGAVPVLENPRIFNDHHGINEFSGDTINSQFDHNQHQGKAAGENPEVPAAYLFEDISNWTFNNGDYNEEPLNCLATDSEMYFPTGHGTNITNQGHGVEDLKELPLSFDQDSDDGNFLEYLLDPDMN